MSAAQTRCDHQSCFQRTFRIPVIRFLRAASYSVYNECDVVWHPAEEEDRYQEQDDHVRPLLLDAFNAGLQPWQDTGAAHDKGGRRHQEAHHVVKQA